MLPLLLTVLTTLSLAFASPTTPPVSPVQDRRGLLPILDPILNLAASPPPKFLQARHPSPECAAINQGELMCCRGTVAGDNQLVVWVSAVYGYHLNPNDINGLDCDTNLTACPGVKVCCQVTALSPLLSLWCQDYTS